MFGRVWALPHAAMTTSADADERTDRREVEQTLTVHPYDPLRFHGTVVWLNEEQEDGEPVRRHHRPNATT